ncbi:glycosyltransferase family 2 protein [Novosphingobium aquiterrae]|uniref:Glycosyltransferase family 2 protein n=1 Tax=Novosphingobium aquiterrae TaxID=624388 RepID=A0ABV6PEG5_9SPHN
MNRDGADFEVVVMALCPEEHFRRFCDYYLDQGASRILVFHDGDPGFSPNDCRIEATVCDSAFWAATGQERPFSVEERQRFIYRQVYARCQARWLLIVDIDEFVFGPKPLDRFFGALDGEPDCVRFTSAEAVYLASENLTRDFGASTFRLPMERHVSPVLARIVYGRMGALFTRGLLGHSRGKQAVRTGNPALVVDIHDAAVRSSDTTRLDATAAHGFHLAHYDAISFPRWAAKCADRLSRLDAQEMGRKRERQLALFASCRTPVEREQLFRRLYTLSWWQKRFLKALRLLCAEAPIMKQAPEPVSPASAHAGHSIRGSMIAQRQDACNSVQQSPTDR